MFESRRALLPSLFALAIAAVSRADVDAAQRLVRPDPRALRGATTRVREALAGQERGETVTIKQSHGGSGKQARAVIDGLEADVVTLALAYDVDALCERGQLDPARLADAAAEQQLPVHVDDRVPRPQGEPEADQGLGRPRARGVAVITPNPKTSGGARWNYLAAWGYALQQARRQTRRRRASSSSAIYKNVPVLDSGARGSTTTFVERGIGDVLIAWENEALLALEQLGKDKFEIVVPSVSILAEPPVAVVDKVVAPHGTRAVAAGVPRVPLHAEAQELIAQALLPPARSRRWPRSTRRSFPKIELFTIDEASAAGRRADDALRRRRRLRPDLSRRDVRGRAHDAARFACERRACCRASGCRSASRSLYLSLLVLHPALGAVPRTASTSAAASFLRSRHVAARARRVRAQLRRRRSPRRWSTPSSALHRRVGARALPLPGRAPRRRAGRSAVRAADRGRRHRAHDAATRRTAGSARCSSRSASRSRSRRSASSIALTFVGLPFVVRTVQPVLEELDPELEEAAAEPRRDALADLPPRARSRRSGPRSSPASRSRSRARSASTARSSSSPATCR